MNLRIPAEWEPHICCWMAWAVHDEWKDWVGDVKEELAAVVRAIAQFEPVRLLTPPEQLADARARFSGGNVEIIEAPVDDIWMRDIAPTFALHGGIAVAIDFNFNAWGNSRRGRPGDRLAGVADVFGVSRICFPSIGEGGAFITDGEGTVVTTESCLLNPNRNPFGSDAVRKAKIERAFEEFGARRVIWLKGNPGEPVTSGHIDGYALFSEPGVLLVENGDDAEGASEQWRTRDITALENSFDAAGRRLRIERIDPPRRHYWKFKNVSFAACYLNAYVANGAVIAARFGDVERDEKAREALTQAFPGRRIEMLRIDHIATGGGGIHCLTQPMANHQAVFI